MDKINELIQAELERANTIHPPLFNSAHEGYAVILEEVEEAQEDIKQIESGIDAIWTLIRCNIDITKAIERVKPYVVNAITELIQVAAMCDKYKQSAEKWNEYDPEKLKKLAKLLE